MLSAEPTSRRELALLFFRLGATAFGGPAAHIAMMHDEVVHRRRWMSEEQFLDLLGATNLIPGPNSTEMAIHIGWERRRWSGLLVAGLAFIFPAMLLTGLLAWAYVEFGALPSAQWLLYGVKPVILGVVAQAIWVLTPKAAPTTRLRLLGLLATVLSAIAINELAVLLGVGVFSMLSSRSLPNQKTAALYPVLPVAHLAASAKLGTIALSSLFWVFFKIGSLLFGSGYVLLAFLRADLVQRLGWLTEAQLVDAIAIGQVTPGPVFTTATFIGYLLSGPSGALAATAGIFLPAFIFVALSGPLVPRIRASVRAAAFLDGVNVASLALMIVATAQLTRAAVTDGTTLVLGIVSAVALVRFKVNSTWLVLGGASAGWAMHALGVLAG